MDVWSAELGSPDWPAAGLLPAADRERAGRILRPDRARRWVASRWALRGVLARYLRQSAAAIELEVGAHGKPLLAGDATGLRFNLSHSGDLALVAVTFDREVGVDLERLGERPRPFYESWTRWEATVKCLGRGLGAPLPDVPVAVSDLDAGPGFAAALAVAGERTPHPRHLVVEPGAVSAQ